MKSKNIDTDSVATDSVSHGNLKPLSIPVPHVARHQRFFFTKMMTKEAEKINVGHSQAKSVFLQGI